MILIFFDSINFNFSIFAVHRKHQVAINNIAMEGMHFGCIGIVFQLFLHRRGSVVKCRYIQRGTFCAKGYKKSFTLTIYMTLHKKEKKRQKEKTKSKDKNAPFSSIKSFFHYI